MSNSHNGTDDIFAPARKLLDVLVMDSSGFLSPLAKEVSIYILGGMWDGAKARNGDGDKAFLISIEALCARMGRKATARGSIGRAVDEAVKSGVIRRYRRDRTKPFVYWPGMATWLPMRADGTYDKKAISDGVRAIVQSSREQHPQGRNVDFKEKIGGDVASKLRHDVASKLRHDVASKLRRDVASKLPKSRLHGVATGREATNEKTPIFIEDTPDHDIELDWGYSETKGNNEGPPNGVSSSSSVSSSEDNDVVLDWGSAEQEAPNVEPNVESNVATENSCTQDPVLPSAGPRFSPSEVSDLMDVWRCSREEVLFRLMEASK